MSELRRRAHGAEQPKTVSRKAAARANSAASSRANSTTTSAANSALGSAAGSAHHSDDEDDVNVSATEQYVPTPLLTISSSCV